MRTSIAAHALIRDEPGPRWLAQWNAAWNGFHLVGGSLHQDESFRDCCIREVSEELGLRAERDFSVSALPVAHLDYVAFSQRAGVDTAYTTELFDVILHHPDARRKVENDPNNRWLTAPEVRTGRCIDGRTVSPTTLRVLRQAGLLTDAPRVLWSLKAHRSLRRGIPEVDDSEMPALADILAAAFPGCDLVVQDVLLGFRPRRDLRILLTEVCDPVGDRSGSFVIKVGPARELDRELAGWQRCRPPGLHHDLVFLPLREGARSSDRVCVVYGDAQQLIGVQSTMTLEDAALDCVRFGVPTVDSVREVLVQLFERAAHLFYHASSEAPPGSLSDRYPDGSFLHERVQLWESRPDLRSIRQEIDSIVNRIDRGAGRMPTRKYLGAVIYLRDVLGRLNTAWRRSSVPEGRTLAPREPAEIVPGLLRGQAHGDLHGRNVLVGMIRERVLWPTVFDYEHMGPCNLVGWDFVKLETELKMRAYPHIFPHDVASFVRGVHDFEVSLSERTEEFHRHGRWPLMPATLSPERARLLAILQEVRTLASLHLSINGRGQLRWLEEYYFLLVAYGVSAGKFENLSRREMTGACLSAGTAAARLTWPRLRYTTERATLGLNDPPAREPAAVVGTPAVDALSRETASYDSLLELAQRWRKSGRADWLTEAVTLLAGLREEYPLALEIGQELALAHLERGDNREAESALHRVAEAGSQGEEVLCRWGRLFKDAGDRLRDENPERADACYALAGQKYDEAYVIRRGHYPGINKATMFLSRAALACRQGDAGAASGFVAQAKALATELLERSEDWPSDHPEDATIWHPATRAEGLLLTGRHAEAAALYRTVSRGAACEPWHRESMRKQVERILVFQVALGEAVAEFGEVAVVFGLVSA